MDATAGTVNTAPPPRPSWPRSIAGGLVALTVGPLMGMVVILAVRAILDGVQPVPGPVPAGDNVLGAVSLPGGQLIPLLVLLAAAMIDAAVRRRAFGMIADAEVSYGACLASVIVAPGVWALAGTGPPIVWSIAVCPLFLRWRSTTPAIAIWRGASRSNLIRRRLLVAGCVVICGVALIPVVAAASSVIVPASTFPDQPAVYTNGGSTSMGSGAEYLDTIELPRTAPVTDLTFEVPITNGGVLPITITGASATLTGHALAVRSVALSPVTWGNGSATPPTVTLLHLGRGAGAAILVHLTPLTCARAHRYGPSLTRVTQVRVAYQVADGLLSHTSTVVLPHPLELLCPSGATPIGRALLLNVGA